MEKELTADIKGRIRKEIKNLLNLITELFSEEP